MSPFIYKNNADSLTNNNYIKIKLEGEKTNQFAIGSTVKLYYDNKVYVQEQVPSRGFQSSMDYVMTIGLGGTKIIDSLRVIWPDSKTQKLTTLNVNKTLSLKQIEAKETYKPFQNKKIKTLLTEIDKNQFEEHKENSYSDFDYESLINKKLSEEGPALAIGDVNNDGNEDFYIGGAKNQEGALYLHLGNGRVKKANQKIFVENAYLEDTAAAFFDANGDGYIDLMIGSGGNELREEKNYKVRLYINDGKGNFSGAPNKINAIRKNISVIAPNDFDNDGDVDVFVGARSVVATYGISPHTSIFRK